MPANPILNEGPINSPAAQTLVDRYKANIARNYGQAIADDAGVYVITQSSIDRALMKRSLQQVIMDAAPTGTFQHDGTELGPNLGILRETVEGDMVLTEAQLLVRSHLDSLRQPISRNWVICRS